MNETMEESTSSSQEWSPSKKQQADKFPGDEDEEEDDEVALSQLLAALAAGARAVQGLPVGDDFAFTSSFPEFTSALTTSQTSLVETIQGILDHIHQKDNNDEQQHRVWTVQDVDDPLLWEECADACDALVEQVESYLSHPGAVAQQQVESLQHWSAQARQKSQNAFGRMVEGTVDMPKPQDVYGIDVSHNHRTRAFVPKVHPDKPYSIVPLDLSLRPGHGLEAPRWKMHPDLVAPAHHVPHVYQAEIEALEYRDWQLQAQAPPSGQIPVVTSPLQATWIDTPEALQKLAVRLAQVRHIAMDLEAHSYRSFAGIVCLMQISIRDSSSTDDNTEGNMENYLIDTLALHNHINPCLAPILANPDICKVLHGADSDMCWLQRDFGCYVVNLFDTGRAARALEFPSASFAYLLQHYAGITADKSHQLADWRQRPLPLQLEQYAIQDTHYLLDIYNRLKWDLEQHATASIVQVLDDSKRVSLIRYTGEPFKPSGYQSLLGQSRGRGRTTMELNTEQEAVLKSLWDWRDETARSRDESLAYVCTNTGLVRLALALPTTTTALQALLNPIPPLVLQLAPEILDRIKTVLAQADEEEEEEEDDDDDDDADEEVAQQAVGTRSSAFFKPANAEKGGALRDGIMSPVLGTEALYKEAGWMTPLEQVNMDGVDLATSTGTEDDDVTDPSEKPKRLLSIHTSNQDYTSRMYSEHSIEFGKGSRGRNADGMGAVRAARESSQSPINISIEEDSRQAKQTAALLQSRLSQKESIPAVLGIISPTADVEEDEGVDDIDNDAKESGTGGDLDEDFPIPRSMREIYKISNRNRRNKKAGSPTPERGVTPTNEKEREELLKAEALLRERGDAAAAYFDLGGDGSPGKRPRTRSRTGRESEESVPQEPANADALEDDLAFMQEIGWIKSKEEAQQIKKERYGGGKAAGGETGDGRDEITPGKEMNRHATYGYDYSTTGAVGVMHPTQASNPFFAGAAMTGGPLAQSFAKTDQRPKKTGKGKQQHRRQERPEKKDGRTHSYRKR